MANVNFHNFAQAVDYALQRLWAIEAIYNGRDVFVWLPTGFGKSICFQAPSNSNLFSAASLTPVGGRHLLVSGETTLALLAFVLFSDTCCTDLSKANWEDFASSLKFCKYKQLIMIKHEWRIVDTLRPVCTSSYLFPSIFPRKIGACTSRLIPGPISGPGYEARAKVKYVSTIVNCNLLHVLKNTQLIPVAMKYLLLSCFEGKAIS